MEAQNYGESVQLRETLARSKQVVIALDASPDLDAWGASIALASLLDRLESAYLVVCANPVPLVYQSLCAMDRLLIASHFEQIQQHLPEPDLIIIPDLGNLEQLGQLYSNNVRQFTEIPIVHIDHHRLSNIPASLSLVDKTAAATCEQMFLLYEDLGCPIVPQVGTMLLSGILSDTRSFSTPTVTPRTLRVAASLIEAGADVVSASRFCSSKTVPQLRLWGMALSRVEVALEGKVLIATVTADMLSMSGSVMNDASGLVNFLDSVVEVGVAALLRETAEGDVRVSLRSPQVYPIVQVAMRFGGGGHTYAAACTLKHTGLEQAKIIVLDELSSLVHECDNRQRGGATDTHLKGRVFGKR